MAQRGDADVTTIVSLRGEPNAGKSQLLNRLVGRDVAIVADVAGTTRDTVSVETVVLGSSIRFVDTAGIEDNDGDTADALISQQSQRQAAKASDQAAIRIWCIDSSRDDLEDATNRLATIAGSGRQSVTDLWVGTKSDLPASSRLSEEWILTSSVTDEGLAELKQALVDKIHAIDQEETGAVLGTAARCRETLAGAIAAIEQAVLITNSQQGHEFVSAELRLAAQCLGEVTGAVYTDDILDRVFGRFCIGK